ncbi:MULTISPECIES: transcriptional regulator [Xenorhabdus]|uniref:transcriptional regulator n=1 Tax=Xenorhabdus TaxID=626 RepID=UPI00069AB2C9|nr:MULTISPECIES: transcriptional regulator [Xenorhabdus]
MSVVKTDKLSFLPERKETEKETFKDRLKLLIGKRSVRAAAKDWELSVSTLNNYLNRGTEPTLSVINTISSIENISIDWLANGSREVTNSNVTSVVESVNTDISKHELVQLKQAWDMVFDSIEPSEASDLLKYIHRNGVVSILNRGQKKTLQDAIEDTIDSLPIRDTLKQAIKVALPGDEALDKEILRRISNDEGSVEPETGIVQAVNKNAG